jgi:MbtH protein
MGNPFDRQDGTFLVLVDREGRHSLWPAFVDVPAGWTQAHPAGSRTECLEYIEANWTDLRPKSLVAQATTPEVSRS